MKKLDLGQGYVISCVEQDPTVDVLQERKVLITSNINPNVPEDDEITVVDYPGTPMAMSVFGCVRNVYDLFRGDMGLLSALFPNENNLFDIIKYWDSLPYGKLQIHVDKGEDANAYYDRGDEQSGRTLNFFHYKGQDGNTYSVCDSSDVVAHETGHSILDLIQPSFLEADGGWVGAFHEHFADTVAIYWALSRFDLCEDLILQTKGDLSKPNFIAKLAEEMGEEIGEDGALRNANKAPTTADVENEVHDMSTVITGALWLTFIDLFKFEYNLNKDIQSMERILLDTAEKMRLLALFSIAIYNDQPDSLAKIRDMFIAGANKMLPRDPAGGVVVTALTTHFNNAKPFKKLFYGLKKCNISEIKA